MGKDEDNVPRYRVHHFIGGGWFAVSWVQEDGKMRMRPEIGSSYGGKLRCAVVPTNRVVDLRHRPDESHQRLLWGCRGNFVFTHLSNACNCVQYCEMLTSPSLSLFIDGSLWRCQHHFLFPIQEELAIEGLNSRLLSSSQNARLLLPARSSEPKIKSGACPRSRQIPLIALACTLPNIPKSPSNGILSNLTLT